MRTIGPIALSLVLVLAGCSGVPLIDSQSRMTVTPAEVPPDQQSGTIAPGLTKSEVVDAQALIDAHRQQLANHPVTINYTSRVVTANLTILQQSNTTTHIGKNRTYRYSISTYNRSSASDWKGERWKNETDWYIKSYNNTTIKYHHRPVRERDPVLFDYTPEDLHSLYDISIKKMSNSEGSKRYQLQGLLPTDRQGGPLGPNSTTKSHRLSAVIDEHGFIHEYEHKLRVQNNTTTARYTIHVQYHANTTQPERPAWVDEAVTATKNETTASKTDE